MADSILPSKYIRYLNNTLSVGGIAGFDNNLVILSSSAENIKDLSKNFLDNLNKEIQDQLLNKDISDQDRYILNHKLDTIREIPI